MSLLDQHANDIRKLCSAHKVRRLYAFGSVVTGRLHSDSDVDFIVDFEPLGLREYADNYFNFKFALENALHRPVDLLEEQTIKNPFFQKTVENQRRLIYGH